MTTYEFYLDSYHGSTFQDADQYRMYAARAQAQIDRYKRIYRVVSPTDDGESLAVCALADALCKMDECENKPQSMSVGSVSTTYGQTAYSQTDRAKLLYATARLYLDIYRG